MTELSQSRRRYRSPGRKAQAQRTRQRILESAARLWIRDSYASGSIEAIARDAGVAAETVYLHFETKPGLLKSLLDVSLVGDDEPIALLDRPWTARVRIHRDQARRVRALAGEMTRLLESLGPVHAVMRAAAASEPAIADLARTHAKRRLDGQRNLVAWISELGPLRDGLSVDAATEIYFALTSPELHHLLTVELAWGGRRYEEWLAARLAAELLPPEALHKAQNVPNRRGGRGGGTLSKPGL